MDDGVEGLQEDDVLSELGVHQLDARKSIDILNLRTDLTYLQTAIREHQHVPAVSVALKVSHVFFVFFFLVIFFMLTFTVYTGSSIYIQISPCIFLFCPKLNNASISVWCKSSQPHATTSVQQSLFLLISVAVTTKWIFHCIAR